MKRKLAWALILCTMISVLALPSMAAESTADLEGEILPVLAVLGVMNGDANGDLALDRSVTRAEFVKMAISASSYKEQGTAVTAVSPYPDVRGGAWHSGYITVARNVGLITGYLDGTFRPENPVKLEEAISILLKIMGYGGEDFAAGFPSAHMTLYRALALDEGMTAQQGAALTRRDCAILIYNMLNARTKSGTVYAQQLGYSTDSRGRINYAALTTAKTEGPVLLAESVEAAVGFTPLTVHRDRKMASNEELTAGDVLYYNKDLRTVWAYTRRISGTVQNISPSTAAPTAVTVAGMTVQLGSSSVIYPFSELGTIQVGDSVTLLLGAGDQAVFVLTGEAASDSKIGIVTAVGAVPIDGGLGTTVEQRSITIAATDGNTYTYPYEKSIHEPGDIVSVTVDGGEVTVNTLRDDEKLSGRVREGKLLDNVLDEKTQIIDHMGGRTIKVRAERLEDIYIYPREVLYSKTDGNGHVEYLILENVTGDINDYGVCTYAFESPDLMNMASTWVVSIGGMVKTHSAQAAYGVDVGPVGIVYNMDGSIDRLINLKEADIQRLGSFEATLKGDEKIKLADGVQVYVEIKDGYYLSNLLQISDKTHDLKAYYDDEAKDGGLVRVIVAKEKK